MDPSLVLFQALGRTSSSDPSDAQMNETERIARALNDLGHVALGHSSEEARRALGDEKLREQFQESAALLLDMVAREQRVNPTVVPRSTEVKAALTQFRDLVQDIDWDDVENMARLKTYAQKALEALGFGLPA